MSFIQDHSYQIWKKIRIQNDKLTKFLIIYRILNHLILYEYD
jgi:hypothetical protein